MIITVSFTVGIEMFVLSLGSAKDRASSLLLDVPLCLNCIAPMYLLFNSSTIYKSERISSSTSNIIL
jgi:hypothetical protein